MTAVAQNPVERRSVALTDVQFRAGKDGNTATFSGYASVFNSKTNIRDQLGSYSEQIRPGAFTRAIRERQSVPLLFEHEGLPVARFPGTMTLAEDARGLKVDASLDRRQTLSNDLCIALERGDLKAMSFSFRATSDTWSADYSAREVHDVDLFDASVVTNPAYSDTTAGLRTAQDLAQVRARAVIAAERSGRVLSGANVELVKSAHKAVTTAAKQLKALKKQGKKRKKDAQKKGVGKDQWAGDGKGATNDAGMDWSGDMGGSGSPGSTNQMMPQDGLGPRVGNTGPRSDRTPESVKRAREQVAIARLYGGSGPVRSSDLDALTPAGRAQLDRLRATAAYTAVSLDASRKARAHRSTIARQVAARRRAARRGVR